MNKIPSVMYPTIEIGSSGFSHDTIGLGHISIDARQSNGHYLDLGQIVSVGLSMSTKI